MQTLPPFIVTSGFSSWFLGGTTHVKLAKRVPAWALDTCENVFELGFVLAVEFADMVHGDTHQNRSIVTKARAVGSLPLYLLGLRYKAAAFTCSVASDIRRFNEQE